MNSGTDAVIGMASTKQRAGMRLAASRFLVLGVVSVIAGCGGDGFDSLQTISVDTRSVIIEAMQDPMDDGSTGVRIRRVDELSDVVVYEGSVANDGEDLTLDNIRPDLRSINDLRLCLNGSAQEDVYVRMDVVVRSVSSIERPCTQ